MNKKLKNEDVFNLLRFSLTGRPQGAQMADIAEVIGQK